MTAVSVGSRESKPRLVYVAAIWSLARSVWSIANIYGAIRLGTYELFPQTNSATFAQLPSWAKVNIVVAIVLLIIFALCAVAIWCGYRWGARLLVWISALLLPWNIVRIAAFRGTTDTLIYCFGSLLLTLWLFRQTPMQAYFRLHWNYMTTFAKRRGFDKLDLFAGLILIVTTFVVQIASLAAVLSTAGPH